MKSKFLNAELIHSANEQLSKIEGFENKKIKTIVIRKKSQLNIKSAIDHLNKYLNNINGTEDLYIHSLELEDNIMEDYCHFDPVTQEYICESRLS